MAIAWFLGAILLNEIVPLHLWIDQRNIFMIVPEHLANPYEIKQFLNPPWTALILLPFSLLPLSVSVFVQLSILFCTTAAIIHKFEGSLKSTILTLTSFIAFDNALELNIGWMINVGILLPVWAGVVFIPIKPQIGSGYYLTRSLKDMAVALISFCILLSISFAIWDLWIIDAYESMKATEILDVINVAPSKHLSWPLSFVLGVALLYAGYKRSDPIWIMLSWLFFVPYIALYSLLLYLALLSVRHFRLALIISVSMWIIYVSVILFHLL